MFLQSARLGQVDSEPIAPALTFSRHFGGGVAELLLHIALVDLGRRGEACSEWPANIWPRSPSDRSPPAPAVTAARLISRATSCSFNRSAPTALPCPITRRNNGPLANPSQLQPGCRVPRPGRWRRRSVGRSRPRRPRQAPSIIASRQMHLQSWIRHRADLNEAEQENIIKGAAWARGGRVRPGALPNIGFVLACTSGCSARCGDGPGTFRRTAPNRYRRLMKAG